MTNNSYPKEESLGENCMFWRLDGPQVGCCFPKAELMGRLSCEGIIDDICLFAKDGRIPSSLSEEQKILIKTSPPMLDNRFRLPPGNTV